MKSFLLVSFFILIGHAFIGLPAQTGVKPQFAAVVVNFSQPGHRVKITIDRFSLLQGNYKKNDVPFGEPGSGDFFCFVLNDKREISDSIFIRNPLSVRTEYPDDNGVIGSTILKKTESDELIRFMYKTEMKSLLFRRKAENGRWKTITRVPIKFD